MSKVEEYRKLGNEALLPLAVREPADADAVAVLAERGNAVVDGGLEKVRTVRHRDRNGKPHDCVGTVIRNGEVKSWGCES